MTTLTCCHGDVVIDAGPISIKACYARSAMLTYCHGDLLCLLYILVGYLYSGGSSVFWWAVYILVGYLDFVGVSLF